MRILNLLPLALLAAPAHAQLIVANDQTGSASIYEVNVTTGIATPIYTNTTTDAKAWGMAYDSSTNTLYWNNGSVLYSSPYGNPLVPVNLGTMTFNAASVNFVSLSFRAGKLYGTRNIATEAVYEIDPATRVATQVYVYASTWDFGGLEHDQVNGKLYGLTDGTARGLYEIDLVGMTETLKAPYPGTETDIDGLAVNNGVAYYVTDGPNTTQASFYVFDIATGMQTGTLPSPFTGSGTFSAATWVGPPPLAATAYCFGDGSGTPCPCLPVPLVGDPDKGCPNGFNAGGGKLAASGVASIGADTLVMTCTLINNGGAVIFQGTNDNGGGLGTAFGDGLRCAAGTVRRMRSHPVTTNSHQYPDPSFSDNAISIRGMVLAPGDRWYQGWYRSGLAHCEPTQNYNLTNGVKVTWTP